jgi:riboflavin synthase
MFTGIVQGIATVGAVVDQPGLRSFTLQFAPGFAAGLAIGASVAVDGVCLTVTRLRQDDAADFDVMQQSLALTTLGELAVGSRINVERAARDGAEIGGHPLSGHIDFKATVQAIQQGYIAVNGASLTVAEAQRLPGGAGWFEVWLIPETLRATTFAEKPVGAALNVEIERGTQVFVDTVREAIDERLGPLQPLLQALLNEKGLSLEDLARPAMLPR